MQGIPSWHSWMMECRREHSRSNRRWVSKGHLRIGQWPSTVCPSIQPRDCIPRSSGSFREIPESREIGLEGCGFSCMSHNCSKGPGCGPECILAEIGFGNFLRVVRRVWVVRDPIPSTRRGERCGRSVVGVPAVPRNGCRGRGVVSVRDLDLWT
jgi:hypothetical protein